MALPEEVIKQNILDARNRLVSPISNCLDWREGRAVAVVGGGPSLSNHLEELSKEKFIIACGSVHDFLVKNRINPEYCIVCDPDPIMADYLQLVNFYTTYLIASQCDKKIFDITKGKKRYLWHSIGDKEFNNEMFDGMDDCIPGGCTVGTRAILCAIGMGYKKLNLYGMDSCLDGDKHHAYEFENPNAEKLGDIYEIKLEHSDRTFRLAGYMMMQVKEFQQILLDYANVLEFKVIGDGVLAEISRISSKLAKGQIAKGD